MTTKFIELPLTKEHLKSFASLSKRRSSRFIAVKKNVPMFEITPLSEKELKRLILIQKIEKSRQSVDEGKVYTTKQLRTRLGLV